MHKWYDALWEIEKAGPGGLRPFELKVALLLPQYGPARLLDRMVKPRLIERRDCDEDGRGQACNCDACAQLTGDVDWNWTDAPTLMITEKAARYIQMVSGDA